MRIVNKHIVITGGASGLGRELVRQLVDKNRISVIARPSPGVESLRQEWPDINVYEADLSDMSAVEAAADQLIRSGQKIDVLINNAAVQHTPHFLEDAFRYESIRREIDVNFTSVCTLIYLLLPNLLQSDPSIILNVNSGLAISPKAGSAVYCATKGAMDILSQSLQHQLAHTNVEVKQAFLPLVNTPMTVGRGRGKIPVEQAASDIIRGLSRSGAAIDVGKVKLLRLLHRLSPSLTAHMMKSA